MMVEPSVLRRLHGDNASLGGRDLERSKQICLLHKDVLVAMRNYCASLGLGSDVTSRIDYLIKANSTRYDYLCKHSFKDLCAIAGSHKVLYERPWKLLGDVALASGIIRRR